MADEKIAEIFRRS